MSHISTTNDASQLWFRIANLKPRLRDHISIHRQEYRGVIWYVYQDHATNRFHRFDYSAHQFIGLMDGKRTVQDVWERVKSKLKQQFPDKEEVIKLLGQLHQIDLLQTNTHPDTQELYQRAESLKPKRWKAFARNPISFRLSLFDPEKLLDYTLPAVRPLFSIPALILWAMALMIASALGIGYWEELSSTSIEQALLPNNLLLLGAIYPFIKLLHELGHAFAVKHWGGEVHEIGIIFVLFIPIPYVDASGASAFTHKHQRIVVGAAGIMVELLLACIALLVWLGVEPGLIQTIAFDVMLIAGISTLFFNGNPLLRYDGYYVFSDAIGIPNLASRSNRYIGYLIQRYLFDIKETTSPAHDSGERYWFFFYSPAAFVYRMIVLTVIVLLVADQLFLIGALLGGWIIYKQILSPLFKHTKFVLLHPKTSNSRPRAILASSTMAIFFVGILFAIPFPLVTVAQGVVWLPDDSRIRAGTAGFVNEIFVEADQQVKQGETLISLNDPLLQTRIKTLNAKLQDLNAQYNATWSTDRVQSKILMEQILSLQSDINQAETKINELIIRSPMSGKVIIPNLQDLKGRYIEQGEILAYVMAAKNTSARVVVQQKDMGLLSSVDNVKVAFSGNITNTFPASIKRIIPETGYQLPSAALGTIGGGSLAIDPTDKTGLKVIDKVQEIELELDKDLKDSAYIGKRIYVRFDHGHASLAQQWFKSIQQLFLRRFSV